MILKAEFFLCFLEIEVSKDMNGHPVSDINIPGELIVTTIRRIEGVIIPDPDTKVKEGDMLLAVVRTSGLEKAKKKFSL